MKSKILRIASAVFLAVLLVSCGKTEEAPKAKAPADYKTLYREAFLEYQNSTTEIPKNGKFDFELTANVDGNEKKLESFAGKNFGEIFSSLSLKFYGDYNFSNIERASLLANIKAYLNQGNTWQGDLDMIAEIDSSGSLAYTIRNLDPKLLAFFEIDKETSDTLVSLAEEYRWTSLVSDIGTNFLKEVLVSLKESSEKGPLYQNSKEEEQKIIDAFLKSDTVEILSWQSINDSTERLSFRFNPENFSKFLNETAKILGNGNEKKDFSGDAKTLSDTVRIEGAFDLRNKRVVNSDIKLVLRIAGEDEKTNQKKTDDLVAKIRFALPNPARLDFDIDTQIYANSSPDNVLRLRFKWLIK